LTNVVLFQSVFAGIPILISLRDNVLLLPARSLLVTFCCLGILLPSFLPKLIGAKGIPEGTNDDEEEYLIEPPTIKKSRSSRSRSPGRRGRSVSSLREPSGPAYGRSKIVSRSPSPGPGRGRRSVSFSDDRSVTSELSKDSRGYGRAKIVSRGKRIPGKPRETPAAVKLLVDSIQSVFPKTRMQLKEV
jgi:hypothetical protein